MPKKQVAFIAPFDADKILINIIEEKLKLTTDHYQGAHYFIQSPDRKGIHHPYDLLIVRVDIPGPEPSEIFEEYEPYRKLGNQRDFGQIANSLVQRIRQTENPNQKTPIIFSQTKQDGPIPPNFLYRQGVDLVVGLAPDIKYFVNEVRKLL